MFTGIIEEIGTISSVKSSSEAIVFKIEASKILDDVSLGDSIAVNGVCLTVTTFTKTSFSVDVMPETVRSTSLSTLKTGSKVNLERAMAANGRFGGHFVSGHVDGIAKIVNKKHLSNAVYYDLQVEEKLTDTLIHKGSITVDGISLTIFGLEKEKVTISIIPHTLGETILGTKGIGDIVNIECDLLGKYILKFIDKKEISTSSTLSKSFLEENGYA
ncbi:riboflavin synthase [Bacillus weihaiensis]|uniref:Riboflavin synthase n=1 Tax=Bacillus weihaiensis TaxID=1547283 RepID=A0A1L3MQC2_9BACI|nr:riboflavin synthase [Bacillus weihaiensis]APH04545.1 riboflavin synthase subunit alpha [Bacillus weihaiensis]